LPNVTGFAKRGLPHTSNLPTLTIHKFRLVKAIDLTFDWQEVPTLLNGWIKFQLLRLLITKLWSCRVIELNVCGRPIFANPVTNMETP